MPSGTTRKHQVFVPLLLGPLVHPLNTPRPKHALGGVLSKIRGEILRQGPGCGPSLYDPLTGDSRGGDVGPGAIRAMIETCADRKTGVGCRHVTADFCRCRFAPTHGPRQTGFPLPSASVTILAFCRSCPAQAAAALSSRVKVSPLPPFTGERQTLKTFNFLQEETQNG